MWIPLSRTRQQVSCKRQQVSSKRQQLSFKRQQLSCTRQQLSRAWPQLSRIRQQLSRTRQQLSSKQHQLARTLQQLSRTLQQLSRTRQQVSCTRHLLHRALLKASAIDVPSALSALFRATASTHISKMQHWWSPFIYAVHGFRVYAMILSQCMKKRFTVINIILI